MDAMEKKRGFPNGKNIQKKFGAVPAFSQFDGAEILAKLVTVADPKRLYDQYVSSSLIHYHPAPLHLAPLLSTGNTTSPARSLTRLPWRAIAGPLRRPVSDLPVVVIPVTCRMSCGGVLKEKHSLSSFPNSVSRIHHPCVFAVQRAADSSERLCRSPP